jgi:hypothetical protein
MVSMGDEYTGDEDLPENVALELEPCTQRTSAGDPIGQPCWRCQHTNVVHPGPHNPTLSACVICELIASRVTATYTRAVNAPAGG